MKKPRGFTLLEILMAVSVLGVGLTLIFPLFFRTADHMQYLTDRHEASLILEDLLVDGREYFIEHLNLDGWPSEGEVVRGARIYHYETREQALHDGESLYQIGARVWWDEKTHGKLEKGAYLAV